MQIVTAADRPDLDDRGRRRLPREVAGVHLPRRRGPRSTCRGSRRTSPATTSSSSTRTGRGRRRVGRAVGLGRRPSSDLPDGYDGALARSVDGPRGGSRLHDAELHGGRGDALARQQGLATVVLEELTRRAVEDGLAHVVAPLRPTWKHRYPTYVDGRVRHLDPRGRPLGRPVDPHPPADGRAGARPRAALHGDRGHASRSGRPGPTWRSR